MSDLWHSISSETKLNQLVSGSESRTGDYYLILKHSNRCAISTMAKSRLERKPDPRLTYYIIDVVGSRSLSNSLASTTGVQHESPQAFLFNGSILLDVKSHMGISPGEISKRIDSLIQIQT